MKNKKYVIAVLAAVCAFALAGCGQRVDTPVTEAQTQAPVQKITEAATEKVTEAVTEALEGVGEDQTPVVETEMVTEPVTEAKRDLTSEEEQAEEKELDENKTLYAKDDMNVRTTPDTESAENIFSSYDQGETVTVTGETPNWYVVSKDDTKGYVYKDNLSETTVDPKSEEERAAASTASTSVDNSSYEVGAFAESYTVELAGDANLRVSPDENGEVLDVVPADTIVTATGSTADWYEVSYNGSVGYIHKNLVK